MFNTPILFLIFNRPDTTKQVFEIIRKVRPNKLYLAADGPRASKLGEVDLCMQTRTIVSQIDWDCEVKTLFRTENLGCKVAVSSAIDWFFENEEQGIILEDDCLPNESFFNYCEQLLNKYKEDYRVMHISGCILDYDYKEDYQFSYYFSKLASIWGWATWRRAWKHYDVNMASYNSFVSQKLIIDTIPNPRVRSHFVDMFKQIVFDKKDTWDYQWSYALLSNYGLSVMPLKSMVTNIGFDINALNSKNVESDLANIKAYDLEKINHPNFVVHNTVMDNKYLSNRAFPHFIYRTKIYKKISRWLNKKGK